MKLISAMIVSGMILFSYSCNNDGDKKATENPADSVQPAPAVATEPVFMPFKVIMFKHPVKDYAKLKAVYMAHDSMRKAYGITHYVMGRAMNDSNMVVIVDKIDDVSRAREFTKLPDLKEAMQKAGVTGPPVISFSEVIRNDDSKIEQKDRVMVSHKVKDFNAWLKVYEAEGKATRAANGLLDRGMARDLDDSNMVHIVFAITDMAKAKARTESPELKKIMTDAGVVGPPQVFFYRLDN